jgi:hypothetical protein
MIAFFTGVGMQEESQNQELQTLAEVLNPVPDNFQEIESTEQLVNLLTAWHGTKVEMLKHLHNIPDGVGITINSKDGSTEQYTMSGDLRKGFQFGITCAIAELGTLPFQYGFEPSIFPQEGSDAEPIEQSQPG